MWILGRIRRGVVKVSLTRIQHFVAQFDRLGDKNEIKLRYGPLAEIWIKFVGFHSLLEVNDDTLDHKADRTEYGEVAGITRGRVLVGNT